MQVKTAQQLFKVSGIQQRYYYLYCTVTRAGLKGRGAGGIFTGGPIWRNSWRHRLSKLCFRWFTRFPVCFFR